MRPDKHNRRRPTCTRTARLAISYTLSSAATVKFEITGRLPGRKVGGRCVAQTPVNRGHKRCTRQITVRESTATPTGCRAKHVAYRIIG